MKKSSSIGLILFFLVTLSSFGSGKKDSLYVIEIDGKVLIPKNDDSKLYKIELLCHNTKVDSGIVVDDESFIMKVQKDSWYTIRILKQGYFPMLISINTKLPDYDKFTHVYNFEAELIPETKNISDRDAIDFPIAIISFDNKTDKFVHHPKYTQNIKRSLFSPSTEGGFANVDFN